MKFGGRLIEFCFHSRCLLRPEFVGSSNPLQEALTLCRKFRPLGNSDTFLEVLICLVILPVFNLFVQNSFAVLPSIILRISDSAVTT